MSGQAISEALDEIETGKEIYRIYGKENVILLGYCEIRYIQKSDTPDV